MYSVILPVCHGGKFLDAALASLTRITPPPGGFEILAAGDPAAFPPGEFPPMVRFITAPGNRAAALNAACAAATGEIWVFTDDDCELPRDWLLEIHRALRSAPDAAVIGGRDELPPEAGCFDAALELALNSFVGTGGIRTNTNISAGRYYPKLWHMIVRAGAARQAATGPSIFSPDLDVHEDVEFVDRVAKTGGKIVHIPEITVRHHRDTTFRSCFLRNLRMARVCRAKGIHRRAHLAACLFFAAVAISALASGVFPFMAGLFPLLCGSYASVLGAAGIAAAWSSRRPAMAPMVPAIIFSLHLARAIGYAVIPTPRRGT